MPHVQPLRHVDAPKEVQDIYDDFARRMRFPGPPNFITTQGHAAAVAQGTWDLVRNVLVSGKIERWVKEMIFAAISKDRNCHYCAAAHIACCRMLGVRPELLDALVRDVTQISNPKLRQMILFGLKCSRDPQSLNEDDFNGVRAVGLSQGEIVELIAMSGLAVYANIMADACGMEADPMFDTVAASA